MKKLICCLLLLTSGLYAGSLPNERKPGETAKFHSYDKDLDGISFTITYSAHETADYSAQAKSMADALTAAGAKVRLQQYNSKTREGVFGYYGKGEAEKISTVQKLIGKISDVKFEHSTAFDEPGANPNRMIMIYLIRNKAQ
jgi:acetyl esterase/lipase